MKKIAIFCHKDQPDFPIFLLRYRRGKVKVENLFNCDETGMVQTCGKTMGLPDDEELLEAMKRFKKFHDKRGLRGE